MKTKVIQEKFKSHDLGSAKQLLIKNESSIYSHVFDMIDEQKVTEILKAIIEVKDKDECSVEVTQSQIDKIQRYLRQYNLPQLFCYFAYL